MASEEQESGQVAEAPLHAYGAHPGDPAVPAGRRVQAPRLPATSQALQAPVQALLQQ
ncbi:MAG: hypothetical protein ACYC8T_03650 [Myxococcaceae bacterium]